MGLSRVILEKMCHDHVVIQEMARPMFCDILAENQEESTACELGASCHQHGAGQATNKNTNNHPKTMVAARI